MTEKELLQEALEWREHISKLASDYSDQELFRKRLATIEWLVKCAEKVVGEIKPHGHGYGCLMTTGGLERNGSS